MGEEASRRSRGDSQTDGATGVPGTGAGPESRGAVGSEHRVLKSTFITLTGAAFLAGGFALGMRREMRKFRELAEQQAKGGKYVPPPNFELGARAFVYGSILCWTGGAVAWAAVQYAFGVTNIHEFADAMKVWVPEKSRGLKKFFEGLPLPEGYKRKRAEMLERAEEDEERVQAYFDLAEAAEARAAAQSEKTGGSAAAGGGATGGGLAAPGPSSSEELCE